MSVFGIPPTTSNTSISVAFSIPLSCTEPHCRTSKGKLEFRNDGDVIFRFKCPDSHVQGISMKRTLATILKRDPNWVENYLDGLNK